MDKLTYFYNRKKELEDLISRREHLLGDYVNNQINNEYELELDEIKQSIHEIENNI